MEKIICWALFDSETGDYMSTVDHYFKDRIDIYGTRSKIPELALKDFFEQAIAYIEELA